MNEISLKLSFRKQEKVKFTWNLDKPPMRNFN